MSHKLSSFLICLLFVVVCCASIVTNNDVLNRQKRHVGGLGGRKDVDESKWSILLNHIRNSDLTTDDGRQPATIVRINSAQSQIVAGTRYYINAKFTFSNGEEKDCDLELFEQSLQQGFKVELKCDGLERRQKRAADTLIGGWTDVDEKNIPALQSTVSESLVALGEQENSPTYTLHQILGAKKQVVAGILYDIKADFVEGNVHKNCTLKIWEKPWLRQRTVDISCDDKTFKVIRDAVIERPKLREPLMDEIKLDDDAATFDLFAKFQTQFGRSYADNLEHDMRYRIFRQNLYLIEQLRRFEAGTAEYGITEFADLTTDEYHLRTGLRFDKEWANRVPNAPAVIPDIELPRSFDWREKGAVTDVKNQGECGSCWAFSVTGNIEGLHVVKGGKLESYSEQELLDCDNVDHACNGGLPDNAYQAIERIGGLELEDEYPYHSKQEKCKYNPSLKRISVKGAVDLPNDEAAIAKYLVQNGPISIGLNANAMQFYKGLSTELTSFRISATIFNVDFSYRWHFSSMENTLQANRHRPWRVDRRLWRHRISGIQ